LAYGVAANIGIGAANGYVVAAVARGMCGNMDVNNGA